jgi:hypothetical protein
MRRLPVELPESFRALRDITSSLPNRVGDAPDLHRRELAIVKLTLLPSQKPFSPLNLAGQISRSQNN